MNFQGYSNDKPSSRVLNPPGGRSNNIFGFSEEPKQTTGQEALANKTNRNKDSGVFGNNTAPAENICKPVHPARQSSDIFGQEPNNKQKDQRRGFNTITGEAYQQNEPAKKTEVVVTKEDTKPVIGESNVPEHVKASQDARHNLHTSSRVLQPPGGAQTRLW